MTRPYSFYGAIRAVIERGDGDNTALITERDAYTFRNLACAVDWYAEELRARGIQKGNHAALWAVNSADWLIAFLAIIKLDAVAVLDWSASETGRSVAFAGFTGGCRSLFRLYF